MTETVTLLKQLEVLRTRMLSFDPFHGDATQMGAIGAINFAITYVIEPLDLESPVLFIEAPNNPQERRKSSQGPVWPTCSPCPNTEVVY